MSVDSHVRTREDARELTVVRLPSWLGDAVVAEPVVRALCGDASEAGVAISAEDSSEHERERAPSSAADRPRVRLVAPRKLLELFDGRFVAAERCALSAENPERTAHYDGASRVLLLNGAWRSAWCAWRAGVPTRIGFASGGRGVLLTHPFVQARERGGVPVDLGRAGAWPRVAPRPFSAACRELASAVGLAIVDPRPRLEPRAELVAGVRARLAQRGVTGEFWLVHAGARPDSAKGFPPADMAAALALLAERAPTRDIVLCCAPAEEVAARATRDELVARATQRELAATAPDRELVAAAPGRELVATALHRELVATATRVPRVVLLDDPAPGVGELVALTALCAGVITPDNGARHVAQALGRPTLVLCGPTDPRHTLEHAATTRVLRHEVPCGPCHRERCPLTGAAHLACMHGIGSERIAANASDLFSRRAHDVRDVETVSR